MNDLFARAAKRLQSIASRLLHSFPDVAVWEETGSVVQLASLHLWKDLIEEKAKLTTAREFFCLSAFKMRRVLIDLARKHRGPEGSAANRAPMPGADPSAGGSQAPDKIAALHEINECVDSLPEELCEVVNLLIYWNLTESEAAQALGVSVPSVKRRWKKARLGRVDVHRINSWYVKSYIDELEPSQMDASCWQHCSCGEERQHGLALMEMLRDDFNEVN